MSPKIPKISRNAILGQHFVIFYFVRKGILAFECALPIFWFPKGNNRQHEHLANAGKNINNPNKMHQLSPKWQTGCPIKDIIL